MKILANREELREDMIVANEKQKDLIKKRDLLLDGKKLKDKENAFKINHEVERLQNFIKMAENTLKMSE